jgi:hypothetical protein
MKIANRWSAYYYDTPAQTRYLPGFRPLVSMVAIIKAAAPRRMLKKLAARRPAQAAAARICGDGRAEKRRRRV